jgi:hypothetical protein
MLFHQNIPEEPYFDSDDDSTGPPPLSPGDPCDILDFSQFVDLCRPIVGGSCTYGTGTLFNVVVTDYPGIVVSTPNGGVRCLIDLDDYTQWQQNFPYPCYNGS